MAGMPYMKFFPGDWLKDPEVRSLSLPARGLWFDMLCLMHQSVRKGYLLVGGKIPSHQQLARMTGCPFEEFSLLLTELESSGVFSCTEHGAIFNRRMVKDEHKREACSEAGKRGGGNPAFKGLAKGAPKVQPKVQPNTSVISELIPSGSIPEGGASEKCAILYELYPKHVGRAAAMKAIQKALTKESFATLKGAVEAYALARRGEDQKFTPNPATWFNSERWADDQQNWNTKPPTVSRVATEDDLKRWNPQTGLGEQ